MGSERKKMGKCEDVVCRGDIAPINAKTLVRVHWDNSSERFSALLLWDCSCIISTVSAPPWEWPECSIFPQPSIQTWTITARLQRHFCCTQGLRTSEWWIFPITLLSVQVSGKHRLVDGAFKVLHSCVSLTLALLSNLPHKDSMLKWKGKTQLCSSYIFR